MFSSFNFLDALLTPSNNKTQNVASQKNDYQPKEKHLHSKSDFKPASTDENEDATFPHQALSFSQFSH